jgi:hypothetical protein
MGDACRVSESPATEMAGNPFAVTFFGDSSIFATIHGIIIDIFALIEYVVRPNVLAKAGGSGTGS